MNFLYSLLTKLGTIKSPVLLIGILFFYTINIFAIDVDRNELVVNGCTDPVACNYDEDADTDDGSCSYNDADGNGICDDDEILGCTVAVACNYNSDANVDDGSCDYTSCYVFGCDNIFACNYDPLVDYNDDSCDFTSCAGCTDITSCDYDPTATIADAASCVDFTSCYGCMNADADNYDPTATIDNGICFFGGCTISAACNYDPNANTNDGSCEFTSCSGCTTPTACNYDPSVIYHSAASCVYPDEGYDCFGVCLLDTDGDGICNMFEIPGCDDVDALNYDPTATDNNG